MVGFQLSAKGFLPDGGKVGKSLSLASQIAPRALPLLQSIQVTMLMVTTLLTLQL